MTLVNCVTHCLVPFALAYCFVPAPAFHIQLPSLGLFVYMGPAFGLPFFLLLLLNLLLFYFTDHDYGK